MSFTYLETALRPISPSSFLQLLESIGGDVDWTLGAVEGRGDPGLQGAGHVNVRGPLQREVQSWPEKESKKHETL